MTQSSDHAVPPGLADLPLEVRRAREVLAQREIQDGLTRAHLSIAADKRALAAARQVLSSGAALAPKLTTG